MQDLKGLIRKIKHIDEPEILLKLEHDFNKIGLTVQRTLSNKIYLCKINDDKPSTNKIFEDHIQLGHCNKPITENALSNMISFMLNNSNFESKITTYNPAGNYGIYGSSFHDNLNSSSRLIDAIAEWLNE